jgi:hypothetical protein
MKNLLSKYSPSVHAVAVKRLIELRDGATARSATAGICKDIAFAFIANGIHLGEEPVDSGYDYCRDVFRDMDLPDDPLDYGVHLMWEGEAGTTRRAFAGEMAAHIQENYL